MKNLTFYVLPMCLVANVAHADGVATGTTPDLPTYTNRAEACSAAKDNARSKVLSRTNYYGTVTEFGECDCDSEVNDEGKEIYICTVKARYVSSR